MKSELEQRLYRMKKEELVQLFKELISRHPSLQAEIDHGLNRLATPVIQHAFSSPTELPLKPPSYQQRLAQYPARLQKGETPQAIFDDLVNLLEGAEVYANQNNYQQALDIYAQAIDAYLAADGVLLLSLFDRAIAEFLPQLEMLLTEASSLIISESSQLSEMPELIGISNLNDDTAKILVTMSPLLTPEARRRWLKRLFTLWLKRIDIRQTSEQLQEIMVAVIWSEDVLFLSNLVQSELKHTSSDIHLHVADSTWQSRTHILEQFLQELLQKIQK